MIKQLSLTNYRSREVSFSWDLTHNPFIHGVADRIEHFFPEIVRNYYCFVIFVILSFLVACLSHKYLEAKLVNKLKKNPVRK